MILLVVLAVADLAIGTCIAISAWRRRNRLPELKGDWWSRFETEFETTQDE